MLVKLPYHLLLVCALYSVLLAHWESYIRKSFCCINILKPLGKLTQCWAMWAVQTCTVQCTVPTSYTRCSYSAIASALKIFKLYQFDAFKVHKIRNTIERIYTITPPHQSQPSWAISYILHRAVDRVNAMFIYNLFSVFLVKWKFCINGDIIYRGFGARID